MAVTSSPAGRPPGTRLRAHPVRGPRGVLLTGFGLWYFGLGLGTPLTALYLTEVQHVPVAPVADCLCVAGFASIAACPAAGRSADRFGPSQVCAAMMGLQAAARACVLLGHARVLEFGSLALATSFVPAIVSVRGAVIAHLAGAARARWAGINRAVSNLCYGLGAALAGAALACGTVPAYRAELLVCAVASAAGCGLCGLLARHPSASQDPPSPHCAGRRRALADPGFLAVTATCGGILLLYNDILVFAVPLWVARATAAPGWLVSAALLVNTLGVGALQHPATARITGVRRGARAALAAGALTAAACALLPSSSGSGALRASLIVGAAAVLLTSAEVLQTAAAIVLSYDLAPEGCHGDYQGVFGAGYAALSCVSPALLGLILAHPRPGWYLLAAAVGAAGAPVPLIVGRAARPADARTSEGRPSP